MSAYTLNFCVLMLLVELIVAQGYDDFSWVKNFAAVGDSFTAGIGSGGIYSDTEADRECSRYDYSYPVLMHRFLPNVQKFEYLACSGDTSADIIGQIDEMSPGQDLVVLTAGGNDLCLSSMIATCIVQRLAKEADCQSLIDQASLSASSFLSANIKALIEAIDAKMNRDGVIVLSTYAPFFNAETTACTTENWGWPFNGLRLTNDRRQKFNDLVDKTNNYLKNARDSSSIRNARVKVADWSPWPGMLKGKFCEEGASPNPNDAGNTEMFFKWDTTHIPLGDIPTTGGTGPLRLRGNITSDADAPFEELEYADSSELGIIHEGGMMLKREAKERKRDLKALAARGITAPSCPGMSILTNAVRYFLTDATGKVFHPNQRGHEAIAGFALDQARVARAEVLGIPAPGCVSDYLSCWQPLGSKAYVSAYSLYSNTVDFCNSVAANHPTGITNWAYTKSYNVGTPDESSWSLQLSGGVSDFLEAQCIKAVNRIIDGCDGSSSNPMNWKFGGQNQVGSYEYSISPIRTNKRQYPISPQQTCKSTYKFWFDSYDIYGAGWATWDYGQQSIRPNATACFGAGITNWSFKYYDEPDENGNEWHAWFNSPIWTRERCFNNNKVQEAAGGGSYAGCQGNG